MKQKTILKIFGAVALMLFVAMACGLDFGLPEASGMLTAFAAVVGAPESGTVSVAELDNAGIAEQDIDSEITKISPNKTPLDTITRNIRKTTQCKSQEVKYYTKSNKPFTDMLDNSASGTGISAASPCKEYTETGNGVGKVYIQVAEPKLWRKDDTLLMFDRTMSGKPGAAAIGEAGSFKANQMFHVAEKSEAVLGLVPIGGMNGKAGSNMAEKFVVPNFTADTVLVRMGQAKKEKDLRSEPIAILPTPKTNFCQNFITQVEESTFSALTKKEVEMGIEEFDRDNLESMRAEMELSFLFGTKYKAEGANGDTVYFTGGIANEITKKVTYGTGGSDRSMSAEDYMNMLQEVFVGTNGSPERVLFAGSELIKAFELLRESQKNISGSTVQETYLGVIVSKVVSTFGTIRFVHNPLFDEIGLEDKGLVLDMAHIYRRPFVPMVAKELDLISSGISNSNARTVQECSCMILKYPDCHCWVEPKA